MNARWKHYESRLRRAAGMIEELQDHRRKLRFMLALVSFIAVIGWLT